MWEVKCDLDVKSVGFAAVGAEWPSVYYHMDLKLLLIIYVDDFKLAGPEENMDKGWALLRTKLIIGPEGPLGMYLGCNQKREQMTLHGGILANCVIYDMESFLEQCVNKYLEVAPKNTKMKEAKTPFLQDEGNHGESRNPTTNEGKCCDWCGYVANHAVSQVGGDGTSSSTTKGAIPMVGTKGAIPLVKNEDDGVRGQLADAAASVLMKILYAARMARFDLLRPVQGLAKSFTKWKPRHDEELYKLVCYIHTTKHKKTIGWVGDDLSEVQPHLFSDSDFAGMEGTQKSTSGVHLCLRGPNTSFPLSGQSKRQGCVSLSTTEAELVAAALALKSAGLPVITIMEILKSMIVASNVTGTTDDTQNHLEVPCRQSGHGGSHSVGKKPDDETSESNARDQHFMVA
jgi:hypothetical protein